MRALRRKDRHQIFLEPEGLTTSEIYFNGISTSCRKTSSARSSTPSPAWTGRMTRVGYAIEYTLCRRRKSARRWKPRRRTASYFAGQINGTTGYEEAAAQGLIAGVNAVLGMRGEEPFILARDEAYIGVLIDDLVTKSIASPTACSPPRRVPPAAAPGQRRPPPDGSRQTPRPGRRFPLRKFQTYRQQIDKEIERLKNTT